MLHGNATVIAKSRSKKQCKITFNPVKERRKTTQRGEFQIPLPPFLIIIRA